MIRYNYSDIVLVGFVYTDESGEKRRPAVVISSKSYIQSRNEVIIAAISSNTERILTGDHLITQWQAAGLLFPSVSTGIVRTIKQNMIAKKLGMMPPDDMRNIEKKLLEALGFH